ncbi:CYTH domain-containing protein [Oribacterium sp.]
MGQEIERKWRVRRLPEDYHRYPSKLLEQAYLCQNPTLRIRKESSIFGGEEEGDISGEKEEGSISGEKEGRSISDKNEQVGLSEGKEQEEYIFCYKGKGRLSREEYNLPLTKEAYETLIGKTEGRVIRKRRYAIPQGPYTVELDIFQGELEGLCYAEVEFPSEEEALSFQPLDWFSEELTGEKGYSNAELSFAKELSNLKLKD